MLRSRRRPNTFYRRLIRITFWMVGTMSLYFLAFVVVLYSSFGTVLERTNHKVLQLAVSLMEKELDQLNDLTWTVAMQPEIQNHLDKVGNPESSLEWSRAWDGITESLIRYDPSNWYVASIRILDAAGIEFMVGRDPYNLSSSAKARLIEAARAKEGSSGYIRPNEINDYLIIYRQIRKTRNLDLDHLGVVAIFVDIPAMIRVYERFVEDLRIGIRIFSDGEPLDGGPPIDGLDEFLSADRPFRRFPRLLVDGDRYIGTLSRSTRSHWTYLSTVPMAVLYSRVVTMIVIGLGVYLLLAATVIRLAMSIDERLSVPIADLSKELSKVESGNFDIVLSPDKLNDPTDEIRQLYTDLDISFRKINDLISQDYLKRIELQDAQFRILQSQINPHFLYNTLDTVLWMAKSGDDEMIVRVVKALGNLLRKSLSSDTPLIPIRDELKLLEDYLTIQQTRFGPRLDVEMTVATDAWDCLIPPFTFQPLVENSIHYALEEGQGRCSVRVSSERNGGRLEHRVTDDGPGFTGRQLEEFNRRGVLRSRGSGIGIVNVRDRLDRLFTGLDFRISNREPNGADVVFSYDEGGAR